MTRCTVCEKEISGVTYMLEMPNGDIVVFRFCSWECLNHFVEVDLKNFFDGVKK